MNADEAAELLGVPKATLYIMTHKRLIPHYKPAKHLRFKQSELIDYIENARVAPKVETRNNDKNVTKF